MVRIAYHSFCPARTEGGKLNDLCCFGVIPHDSTALPRASILGAVRRCVLSTLSAWVIGFASFVARVRAGAEVRCFPSARFYGMTIFMKKSIKVTPKKRGRGRPPTGGRDPARTIRLSDEFIATVDTWAAGQDDAPGRSEAIRRLVEIGLKAKK
jgi:hypothetical protein